MNTKLIYAGIIAALFIVAIIFFNDTMSLEAIILAFIGASSTIGWIWTWISREEDKTIFKQAMGGKSVAEYKAEK